MSSLLLSRGRRFEGKYQLPTMARLFPEVTRRPSPQMGYWFTATASTAQSNAGIKERTNLLSASPERRHSTQTSAALLLAGPSTEPTSVNNP
jgi:hypothetical protein